MYCWQSCTESVSFHFSVSNVWTKISTWWHVCLLFDHWQFISWSCLIQEEHIESIMLNVEPYTLSWHTRYLNLIGWNHCCWIATNHFICGSKDTYSGYAQRCWCRLLMHITTKALKALLYQRSSDAPMWNTAI